jgi:hypothetical protein
MVRSSNQEHTSRSKLHRAMARSPVGATPSTEGLLWGNECETFGRAPGVVARPRHSAHAARGVLGDHATELLRLPIRTIHESPSYPSSKERFSEMMVFCHGRGVQRKGRIGASTTGEWIMRRKHFLVRLFLMQILLGVNIVIVWGTPTNCCSPCFYRQVSVRHFWAKMRARFAPKSVALPSGVQIRAA